MNYTFSQLEGLWIQAGGRKSLAPLMAAIAMAESRGDPTAKNASGATGLWQILGAVNPRDQKRLTDPQVNAHEAVLKYRDQGLTAWATYNDGSYKDFLPKHYVPPKNAGGGGGGQNIQTTSVLSGLLGSLISPDTIERVGLIVLGAFLIIVGIIILGGGKTLELVTDASKPKANAKAKSGVRKREGSASVLRDGDGEGQEASETTQEEAA